MNHRRCWMVNTNRIWNSIPKFGTPMWKWMRSRRSSIGCRVGSGIIRFGNATLNHPLACELSAGEHLLRTQCCHRWLGSWFRLHGAISGADKFAAISGYSIPRRAPSAVFFVFCLPDPFAWTPLHHLRLHSLGFYLVHLALHSLGFTFTWVASTWTGSTCRPGGSHSAGLCRCNSNEV